MPRIWRGLLSCLVTLAVVVGLAPLSVALPPGVVLPGIVTVPPVEGMSGPSERTLRYPVDSGVAAFARASGASISAYRVAPGIAVANRAIISGSTIEPQPSSSWGAALPDEQVQTQVNDVVAMLARIRATDVGRTLLETIANAEPIPGGRANRWRDWSTGSDNGASDIHLLIFPTTPGSTIQAAAASLRPLDTTTGIGSDSFLMLDPRLLVTYYDSDDGVLRGLDPTITFAHEMIHVAHGLVGGRAPNTAASVPISAFESDAPANPRPSSPIGFATYPVPVEELLTHGGPFGMASAQEAIAELPGHASYSNTRENPFVASAVNAAIAARNANSAGNLEATVEARTQLSRVNPTETTLAAALQVDNRSEYVTGQYLDADGGFSFDSPSFTITSGVAPTNITAADLESPATSQRLAAAVLPVTNAASACDSYVYSSLTCRVEQSKTTRLSAEGFLAFKGRAAAVAAAAVSVFPHDSAIVSPGGLSLLSTSSWAARLGLPGSGYAQFGTQLDSDYRKWNFVSSGSGSGWGQIMNKASGYCLRVSDSRGLLTSVEVKPCNSSGSFWAVYPVGDGVHVRLMNSELRMCLRASVESFGLTWGVFDSCYGSDTKMTLTPAVNAAGSTNDEFKRSIPDVGHVLVGQKSGQCVQIGEANSLSTSVSLTQETCDSSSSRQLWSFFPESGVMTVAVDTPVVGSTMKSSLCLTAPSGTSLVAAVTANQCDGSASQKWSFSSNGNLVNRGNQQCLTVRNASTAPGTGIVQYSCNSGANEVWNMPTLLADNAPVMLASLKSQEQGRVLDNLDNKVVVNRSDARDSQQLLYQRLPHESFGYLISEGPDRFGHSGDRLCVQQGGQTTLWVVCDAGAAAQRWTPSVNIDGSVIFTSVGDGSKCLDLIANNDSDMATVGAFDCHSSDNQKWRVLPVSEELSVSPNAPLEAAPAAPPAAGWGPFGVNWAGTGTATQSTTWGNGSSSAAHFAINEALGDNNRDGRVASTSGSSSDAFPWWQDDMGESHSISAVNVYNRTDCCTERLARYWVFASNTAFNTSLAPSVQATQPGVIARFVEAQAASPTQVDMPWGVVRARYLMIQLDRVGVLNLAQVTTTSPATTGSSKAVPGVNGTYSWVLGQSGCNDSATKAEGSAPVAVVDSTIVPGGVTTATMTVVGGVGGASYGVNGGGGQSSGGDGGAVTTTVAVAAGQVISGVVGCTGTRRGGTANNDRYWGAAGWSNGGQYSRGGGGGGGSSAVCLGTKDCLATALHANDAAVTNRLKNFTGPIVIAGGGGGSGGGTCAGKHGKIGGAGGGEDSSNVATRETWNSTVSSYTGPSGSNGGSSTDDEGKGGVNSNTSSSNGWDVETNYGPGGGGAGLTGGLSGSQNFADGGALCVNQGGGGGGSSATADGASLTNTVYTTSNTPGITITFQ